MRTSGSSTGRGKLRLVAALVVSFAGAALAAEVWTQDVPASDAYVVTAVLLPGSAGAEVLGGDKGFDHVTFRVAFGADLSLSVNGVDAGTFNPAEAHTVTVSCIKVGPQWLATTRVVNELTGSPIFEQVNYRMQLAAEEVRAEAEDVLGLEIN